MTKKLSGVESQREDVVLMLIDLVLRQRDLHEMTSIAKSHIVARLVLAISKFVLKSEKQT